MFNEYICFDFSGQKGFMSIPKITDSHGSIYMSICLIL